MRAEDLSIDGRRVRLWRGGDGAPLLLLPGAMADARLHWEPIWSRLAARHEVFAPDLPGLGGSQGLAKTTLPALIDWLDGLGGHLPLAGVGIVGNAFGASLARAYAAARPRIARALVMINGGRLPRLSDWALSALAPLTDPGARSRLVLSRASLAQMLGRPDALDERAIAACLSTPPDGRRLEKAISGPPVDGAVTASTLLLWGDRDRVTPATVGERIAAEMPCALFRRLPGVGRLPQVEAPDATADAILRFLA